jgi:hypothetical protein
MTEIPGDFVPALDDVDFEQLVELGRSQIPRYAADWTDHNLHDPGMTLLDLLAWIVDQQVYRAGFVGSRHRRSFAALLGQHPEGPVPARGLVWPSGAVSEGRLVARDTPVVCRARPTLPFVLDRTLYLTPARLVGGHRTVDGRDLPAPETDLHGATWNLHDEHARPLSAVTLRFDRPLGRRDHRASVSFGFDVVPPPGPAPTPDGPSWGPVRYEYREGGQGRWTALPTEHDRTLGMATSGEVVLDMPPAASGAAESELRISFERGFFPRPPRVRAIAVNVLPLVQWEQSDAAPFPTSGTGEPDQRIDLVTGNLTVVPDRAGGELLEVTVDRQTWTVTEDLRTSGPGDPHVEVHADHLVFGNGLNGRCPPPGAWIGHTGLTRTAGAEGNVRPHLDWQVPALTDLMSDYGTNRHGFTGGRDRTSAAELVARARTAALRRQALVTDDDVIRAASALPGLAVGRAEVISRFDPRLPGRPVDGVRTLVVAPVGFSPAAAGTSADASAGVPAAYVREVATHLERRRILGERLVVQGPTIVVADLQITVTTKPWASFPAARAAVERAVAHRLAVVQLDDEVPPWPLGRDLTVSDVLSIVASVDDVATVPVVRMAAAGRLLGDGPVVVPQDGVVVAGTVTVDQRPAGGLGRTAPTQRRWD